MYVIITNSFQFGHKTFVTDFHGFVMQNWKLELWCYIHSGRIHVSDI